MGFYLNKLADRFRDIKFPTTYEYIADSKHVPLEFYEETFPISKTIDLLLGYFTTNAIKVISHSMAEFIFNGGKMRIIANHVFREADYQNLFENREVQDEFSLISIFSDLDKLQKTLSKEGKHFFDCLKYLMSEGRLQIVPVFFNQSNLNHYKRILLYDGHDYIATQGSNNFTLPALIKNGEGFQVDAPWNGKISRDRIEALKIRFENIINNRHEDYTLLEKNQLERIVNAVGRKKEIQELLDDSLELSDDHHGKKVEEILKNKRIRFKRKLRTSNESPVFPYPKPHDYQLEALKAWKENNFKGIFAMATGTGKTLTAINCLIDIYSNDKIQKNIIVVPGLELVRQWSDELKSANFKAPFIWASINNRLGRDIENIRILKNSNELNIVITYDSLKSNKFLNLFENDLSEFTVVFDEVHNMGASGVRNALDKVSFKKVIGLSATPLRLWDDNNENQFIEDFFDSPPPYTYSYSMEKAIKSGFLCSYYYTPYFAYLEDDEWDQYLEFTRRIPLGKDGDINNTAALLRQLLLDRANGKEAVLLRIVQELMEKGTYKYTLIYCPKGSDPNNEERIIESLESKLSSRYQKKRIRFNRYVAETEHRELVLREFEDGDIDFLLAIKCLDEGVNIPRTENAIFMASGRNYREFVQRRGRILRTYKSEEYVKENAFIYDIVVLPTLEQFQRNKQTALKLIINEFKRLFEFSKLARPDNKVFERIEDELRRYDGITQYHLEKLIENQNNEI